MDKFYRDLEAVGIIKARPVECVVKLSHMEYNEATAKYHGISFGQNDPGLIEIYINYDSWINFTKAQRYWLMYHELCHDVLDLEDLPDKESSYGKLMCPLVSRFENISMDQFIEAFHQVEAEYLGVESIL